MREPYSVHLVRAPAPPRRSRTRPATARRWHVTAIGDPPRRSGPGLRGVRGPGGLPGPQLPRRAQLAPRRRTGRRARRVRRASGWWSPDRPGMGHSTFQPGRTARRLARRRDLAGRRARHRAIRRHGLVGGRAVRRGVRGQARRACDRGRPALERGAARSLRDEPRAGRRGPHPALPVPAHAGAGVAGHEAQHRQRQQRPPSACGHARLPTGRPPVLIEWGPADQALAFVREAVRQGTEGCVQDYRIFGEPVGVLAERDPGARCRSGRGRTTTRDRPATAPSSRITSPALPSPWSRAKATCRSCRIRRPPSSRRWSAATAPSRQRSRTSGRRRSRCGRSRPAKTLPAVQYVVPPRGFSVGNPADDGLGLDPT